MGTLQKEDVLNPNFVIGEIGGRFRSQGRIPYLLAQVDYSPVSRGARPVGQSVTLDVPNNIHRYRVSVYQGPTGVFLRLDGQGREAWARLMDRQGQGLMDIQAAERVYTELLHPRSEMRRVMEGVIRDLRDLLRRLDRQGFWETPPLASLGRDLPTPPAKESGMDLSA